MMKKIVAMMLCLMMVLSVTACGKNGKNKSQETADKKTEKPAACDIMTIKKYKGLEVQKVDPVAVTDEDVENSIRTTMQSMEMSKSKEVKKGKAEDGDIATIDFEGKKDGVAFDGGTAQDYALTLGSNSFIPGFEEGVIGHKVGETFDLDLTFPEDYNNADLAGQPVVFTVTIKKLTKVTYPELTDEVATKLNGDTPITVAAYKAQVMAELEKNNQASLDAVKSNLVWDALMKGCVVEAYPEKDLEEEESNLVESVQYQAYMYGYQSVDQFVLDMTGQRIDVYIKNTLKQRYAIEIIAYEQNLNVSEEAYQEGLKKYAEESGYDSSDPEKLAEFEQTSTKEYIKERLQYDLVTEYLLANCKWVEKTEEATE